MSTSSAGILRRRAAGVRPGLAAAGPGAISVSL